MKKWRGKYRQQTFSFEGRKAILVFPDQPDSAGRWVLKTEYFSAFQDLEEKLVENGFHLLWLANHNRWGTNDDLDVKERFVRAMSHDCGLNQKGALIGMSCGGLHAIKQAARHPHMASLLYLDAPVVNLLSCPFGLGDRGTTIDASAKQEALDALGFTMSQMIAYREHPLDKLPVLIANRIPAMLVWGEEDTVVPFEENGQYVLNAYKDTNIPFLCQSKPNTNHHPHGPKDMEKALAFILKYT